MQKIRLETLEIMIKEKYSIGEVIGIKPFIPFFSKFKDLSTFFSVVETSRGSFFVKRYPFSQIERARNDVEKATHYLSNTSLPIPQLLKNRDRNYLTEFDGDIFTVARFIDGVDLRTEAEVHGQDNNEEFFKLYTFTNIELKKLSSDRNYHFRDRYSFFIDNLQKLEKALKTSELSLANEHSEYLEFLKSEVNLNKQKILSFQTQGQILHGDFLKQNIIRDNNNKFWIVDWEKSDYGFLEVDLMKTITFTLFKPDPKKINLKVSEIVDVFKSIYPYLKSALSYNLMSEIVNIYYYFLITNIHSLIRLHVFKVGVKEQMIAEDYNITRWYKEHLDEFKTELEKLSK